MEDFSDLRDKNMKNCFVYIMANDNRTIYIGVTSELPKRVYQHREKLVEGFTKTYGLDRLVYWELCGTPETAILREKQLKRWSRAKKTALIEGKNPEWEDLWAEITR